jgi:hypothetical protein
MIYDIEIAHLAGVVYDAEAALEEAGRPEGELLATGIRALCEERARLEAELAVWRSKGNDEEAPFPVFVARQIACGASYDGDSGIWWTATDKPGIMRKLKAERDRLTAALAASETERRALQIERDDLKFRCRELQEYSEHLEGGHLRDKTAAKRVHELVEAAEFYGDPNCYHECQSYSELLGKTITVVPIFSDKGQKARAALVRYRGGQHGA